MIFTREQLIEYADEEKYLKALELCNIHNRCLAKRQRRISNNELVDVTWHIVPSPNRNMLALITDYEWNLKQDGVGNIIHDKLELR